MPRKYESRHRHGHGAKPGENANGENPPSRTGQRHDQANERHRQPDVPDAERPDGQPPTFVALKPGRRIHARSVESYVRAAGGDPRRVTFPNDGADDDRLASGLAATPCPKEHQPDDRRRYQEKSVIKSPAGAEERVEHDASEDEEKHENENNTCPVPLSGTHALNGRTRANCLEQHSRTPDAARLSCAQGPARAYMERKQAEGKSRREALRALKRHLARTIHTTLKNEVRLT